MNQETRGEGIAEVERKTTAMRRERRKTGESQKKMREEGRRGEGERKKKRFLEEFALRVRWKFLQLLHEKC
jgi:hypothetical protein